MKGLNSVKLVLLVSAVLLVFSAGFYFYQVHSLKSLTRDVGICFHQNLPEVGRIGREITVKQTEIEGDEKRGVETHSYVEERANESNIRYGFLKTSKPREYPNKREGYTDIKIEITPSGSRKNKQLFHRQYIAKFLFLLENRTNCLKVTSLSLTDPSEDHESWSMRLDITERKPLK
jgi:hypothetical protein